MDCNTLKNISEHFINNSLVGDRRTISPQDYNAVENETKFLVKFTTNLAGSLVYNGYVYISSLTIDGPMEDVVTYSGTLQGTEILADTIA